MFHAVLTFFILSLSLITKHSVPSLSQYLQLHAPSFPLQTKKYCCMIMTLSHNYVYDTDLAKRGPFIYGSNIKIVFGIVLYGIF